MFATQARNLAIAFSAALLVASLILWPPDADRPEASLTRLGARLAYAFDGTLLVGVRFDNPNIGDDEAELISRISTIQRVELSRSRVTSRGITSLRVLPKLLGLNLSGTQGTPDTIDAICQIPWLTELYLDDCDWVSDADVDQLTALQQLEILSLSGTVVTPGCLNAISRLPSLKSLSLDRCPNFGDDAVDDLITLLQSRSFQVTLTGTEISRHGLRRLCQRVPMTQLSLDPNLMPDLRSLGSRGHFGFNAEGNIVRFRRRIDSDGTVHLLQPGDLTIVGTIDELEELFLDDTNVSNDMLFEIGDLPSLRSLSLSGTDIMDDGLQCLSGFPQLESLSLLDTAIEGPGLVHLIHVPKLTELHVRILRGDDALCHLCSLSDLESLTIHAPLTDDGLALISRLHGLETLRLIGTKVSSIGLQCLLELGNLHEMVIEGGIVDDSAIATVAAFPELQRVILARTRVTTTGLNRLRVLRPKLHVAQADQMHTSRFDRP